MSGSKMWKNQIGGYSDIQKRGKMMSGFLWIISPTFHACVLFFYFFKWARTSTLREHTTRQHLGSLLSALSASACWLQTSTLS
jgi:hypothetical protein